MKSRTRRLLVLLILLLLLLWFAPILIARTSWRDTFASKVIGDIHGSVHVGKASFSWLSPVVLEDVEMRDESGALVLSAPRVESERTLLGLLFHRSNPGEFRCERPKLDLVLRGTTSNVEQVFAEYLKPSASSGNRAFGLEVIEGGIDLRDADTDRVWQLAPVSMSMQLDAKGLHVNLDAKQANGEIVLAMTREEVSLKATALPLDLLETLSRRLDIGTWHVGGVGDVTACGRWKAGSLDCDEVKLSLREFRCEGPGLWVQEPSVELTGKLRMNVKTGEIDLSEASLLTATVSAQAPRLRFGTGGLTDIDGEIAARGDLTRLQRWLIGPGAKAAYPVSGAAAARIELRPGTRSLDTTTSLTLDNLLVGPSWHEPRVHLTGLLSYHPESGNITFSRLGVTTTDLSGTASGRLAQSQLHLERGTGLQRTRITPRVAAGAMKYAVPALAGATEADGEFSLVLDSGCLPVDDPSRGSLSGQLTIHAARLAATAPLVRELTSLLSGRSDVRLRGESRVTFRMENGRVYHEGLEIVFPEMSVKTSGWVGLDGSLAMMAEFPIPPRWLGTGAVSQSLMKQTIRIPITGTLDSPKLDQLALREVSGRIARETAKDLLEKKIESGLQKLIKPKGK